MATRVFALSLMVLGSAAAQVPNALPVAVFDSQALSSAGDFQFDVKPLVHGPYSLVVLNPNARPVSVLLNGFPVPGLNGLVVVQPVTLDAHNSISIQLGGGVSEVWVAVLGFQYAFAHDYDGIPSTGVLSPGAGDVDWRTKGAVTPVKNQGSCPASWAFSATGLLEGHVMITHGNLSSLSEQEIIDCSPAPGCSRGDVPVALKWVASNDGDGSEASYPYTGNGKNTCKSVPSIPFTGTFSIERGPVDDESTLAAMLDSGPVSAVINSNWFSTYRFGIANPDCESQIPTYSSVLIVGHIAGGPTPYWIIKTSLGSSWGNRGYFYLVSGQNKCGIADYAVRLQ